ncbi:MAG: sigma-54-dependent Fis family transcriptional regulator [Deltaproteobacteria bacterium]|nr:sigma-54-dependent Fis family transcriptional regulator [Deltaproteobacteria bacterium]
MTDAKTILVVDDDDAFRTVLAAELRHRGFAVTAAATGAEALEKLGAEPPNVVLLDLRLPDIDGLKVLAAGREKNAGVEFIMLTGHGTIDTAIEAIRMGAFDYTAKPCPMDELEIRIARACERQELRKRNDLLERALAPGDGASACVGDSPAFREVLRLVDKVAPTNSTVLITGETGVGKEVIAKLTHKKSLRAAKPFVTVECAALQESLLQSELFGHVQGAFTGAERSKPGLFEVADGGTIFLDEIGEVSPATQVKLLRVLDASTFRRVGGTTETKVDVRVLAATNRDLPALVRQGLFREDFLYRISTVSIRLPPLRDRKDDIDALTRHLLTVFNERFGTARKIGGAALALLYAYDWPGNVRQLLHALESAMIVCDGPEIEPRHLPASLAIRAPAPALLVAAAPEPLLSLKELERRHIERVLAATQGRRKEAAQVLGISERNLYRKIDEFGLGGAKA